jgi:cell division septation protein DedD
MITLASRILQKMLDVNRYAALPFVEAGKHNDTRPWLLDLRERLIGVLADIDRAVVEVPGLHTGDEQRWSQAEQLAFSEWLSREYPNEHSAGAIALGDAWQEGKRYGIASAPLQATENPVEAPAASGLVDGCGQLSRSGKVLADAIAAALASASAAAQSPA